MRACNCARASPFQSRTCEGCDGKSNCGKTALRWFQSTHPRGVRRRRGKPACGSDGFNPRPRVGCDLPVRRRAMRFYRFNPRTRVGCDLRRKHGVIHIQRVSIHAPAWGATRPSRPASTCCASFNPRTRVGCDFLTPPPASPTRSFNPRTRVGCDFITCNERLAHDVVSIHAPAWGATRPQGGPGVAGWVSIHAPAWGATLPQDRLTHGLSHVSIHAPAWGATRQYFDQKVLHNVVSIHAPAWGATGLPRTVCGLQSSFNPRTRVGCDVGGLHGLSSLSLFQSTHPRGVRQDARRHRDGAGGVSIHAPAWGATVSMFYPVDSRD